jgi:predicted outer membrane repeat protein
MFGLFRRRSTFGQESNRLPRSAKPAPASLHVEELEARCTPTTVTNLGDVSGDPNSLRGAIAATAAGGTVNFAAGLSGTIVLTTAAGGEIAIAKNLTIQGPGAATVTVRAAPNARIFNMTAGGSTIAISGLTLTGANSAAVEGGAIASQDTLTISNSVITGNAAGKRGGGLYQQNGSLTVLNSTISNNIANNRKGGGISANNCTVLVQNSSLTGNTSIGSTSTGGGAAAFFLGTGAKTVQNCTIANNTGNYGAIYFYNAAPGSLVQNCTIANNTGVLVTARPNLSGGGAGIQLYTGTLTVENCTITGNTQLNSFGGGIRVKSNSYYGSTKTATLNLISTIVSGNTDKTGPNEVSRYPNANVTLNASNDLFQTAPATGVINGTNSANITGMNPMLGPLQNNGGPTLTEALLAGSPAIDAGSNPAGLTTDQRGPGFNRTIGSATDIGAYEFQPPATTTTLVSSLNPSAVGQSVTFTATVTATAAGSDPLQGSVTFTIDGQAGPTVTLSGTSASLTATFTTSSLSPGSHIIMAQYGGFTLGNFGFSASSGSVTQTVSGPTAAPATNFVAIAADAGGGPQVTVYNSATNAVASVFFAFTPSFTGGVRVAVDDINGDGVQDIICAAGPGGGPQVEVIDGTKLSQLQSNGQIANSALITSFFAFNAPTFTGGVFVAAGQASSGQNWVVVGAGAGGGPQVTVYTAKALVTAGVGGTPASIANFFAFAPSFTGGVTVAVGDTTGSGKLNVIIGAGPGGGPQVIVVSGSTFGSGFTTQSNGQVLNSSVLANFFAFAPNFTGGVFVSGGLFAGQFNLIIGAGPGGGPEVIAVNGSQLTNLQSNGQITNSALLDNFFAMPSGFMGGVRVGFDATFGSTPRAAILTAAGPSGSPEVNVFDALSQKSLVAFFFLPASFAGGAFVSG